MKSSMPLVDADRRLRYANPSAQRMLAGSEGWRLRHGRVRADSPAVQEQLKHGVKAACCRPGSVGGCSWHTARTHSKNLLRKTGLHSQQDVAALVWGLM